MEKEQKWWSDLLGIHHRYYVQNQDDVRIGSWLSRTNIAHEIALMRNANQDRCHFSITWHTIWIHQMSYQARI